MTQYFRTKGVISVKKYYWFCNMKRVFTAIAIAAFSIMGV